jgi:F0F1-type ATP synthase membrane subunit a
MSLNAVLNVSECIDLSFKLYGRFFGGLVFVFVLLVLVCSLRVRHFVDANLDRVKS